MKSMDVKPGERVLEVACGTARNLVGSGEQFEARAGIVRADGVVLEC